MKLTHVSLRIKPEKVAFYEKTFLALRSLTLQNEPGCRIFELCRDSAEPYAYHVFEGYDDDEAIRVHATAPYYAEHANAFLGCIAGDHMAEIERLGLTGRAMFDVIKNVKFERFETVSSGQIS